MWQKEAIILRRNGSSCIADVYYNAGGDLYYMRGTVKVWVRKSNWAGCDFTEL